MSEISSECILKMALPEKLLGERKLRPCAMPSCRGKRFDLVHKFPMDNERAENWRSLIDVPELNQMPLDLLRKKYFLCSKHFRKTDYKNCESRSLNQTAYPRLLLKEDSADAPSTDDAKRINVSPQNSDVSSTKSDDTFLLPEIENRSMSVLNSTFASPVEIIDVEPEASSSEPVTVTMSITPTISVKTRKLRRPIFAKRIQVQMKRTKQNQCIDVVAIDNKDPNPNERRSCKFRWRIEVGGIFFFGLYRSDKLVFIYFIYSLIALKAGSLHSILQRMLNVILLAWHAVNLSHNSNDTLFLQCSWQQAVNCLCVQNLIFFVQINKKYTIYHIHHSILYVFVYCVIIIINSQ